MRLEPPLRTTPRWITVGVSTAAIISTALSVTASHAAASSASDASLADYPTLARLAKQAKADGVPMIKKVVAHGAKKVRNEKPYQPDGPVTLPDTTIDGLSVNELVDLNQAAINDGISLPEEISRYGWQGEFTNFASWLRQTYPGEIADIAMTENGRGARFGFKGKIPAKVQAKAKDLPVPVQFAADKGYTDDEVLAEAGKAVASIRERPDVALARVAGIDNETGRITIDVKPQDVPATMKEKDAFADKVRPVKPDNPNVSITVAVNSQLKEQVFTDEWLRGGGYWFGETHGCTSGFNITNSEGVRWSSTAKHCSLDSAGKEHPNATYQQHSGDGKSSTHIDLKKHSPGGFTGGLDLGGWSMGSMSGSRVFYYDWNYKRYADAVGRPEYGTKVCHFGITTGASCSTVHRFTGERGEVVTKETIDEGGDSGGPWYWGGTAYGIHSGHFVSGGSVFAAAYLFPSSSGLKGFSVWTR